MGETLVVVLIVAAAVCYGGWRFWTNSKGGGCACGSGGCGRKSQAKKNTQDFSCVCVEMDGDVSCVGHCEDEATEKAASSPAGEKK